MDDLSLLDSSWVLLSAFLVTTMLIGFCMLEAGLVHRKNSVDVAFRNLTSFVVSALVFWLVGFGLMFGAGHDSGLFGTDLFRRGHGDGSGAFFFYHLALCSVAATIVGSALAERTRVSASLLIAALVAAIFYPLVGHWIWGGLLENGTPGWLAERGFVDFAGSTVVHGTGGWLALAAALVVGPRLGRFGGEAVPLRGGNYPLATAGVLVLWFGWFGFNGGGAYGYDARVAVILVNTSLAAAAGGCTLLGFAWLTRRKPDIVATLNGTIAGLVGVTAGCHLYEAQDAVLVGVVAATACALAIGLLRRCKIDDVLAAWPAHAVAGIAGTLMVATLGDPAGFPLGLTRVDQLLVQLTGIGAVAAFVGLGGFVTLWVLDRLFRFRVSEADERSGLDIAEHDAAIDLVEAPDRAEPRRRPGDSPPPATIDARADDDRTAEEHERALERARLEVDARDRPALPAQEATEFRVIFENTHEGILQFARDGRIMRANSAALALLGYASEKDLVSGAGRWLSKLDGIDRARHVRILRTLESSGMAQEPELSFTRPLDGLTAHVQLDLRRVHGREGAPSTVLGSIVDVGERQANERLREERDAAIAASRAKSEFLASMSHEIRTPLNGVIGMLELLGRTELDGRQSRFVDLADTSAAALLSVIDDILDLSKIEAGKLELERTAFDLPELLSEVVEMFAPQAAGKGIELASLVPANLPVRVVGDPERLRQVLVNLVGNAIKFTERGAVTLRCRTSRVGPEETRFRVDVEDSGSGIPPAELERLFQPFAQADSSIRRTHGGTGLGLTISRRLASLMGGEITADSTPGRGTTFRLELPLPLAPAPAVPDPTPRPLTPENVRVLAVDDHPLDLELLVALLEPEGFDVDCVDGAEAALAALAGAAAEGRPYRLALLDYPPPGTDGEALTRAIRADRRYDEVDLLVLSSNEQAIGPDARAKLRIAGSVVKPLRRSRLFDAIDRALGGAPSGRKPPVATPIGQLGIEPASPLRSAPTDAAERPLRVLVAEDNPVNRAVAEELLLVAGHSVVVAHNGAEALERLATDDGIELVLMDCRMPIMDGFEATRRLREIEGREGRARVPVIAVTANALKGDRERCLEAGMDDYVAKPIDVERLEEAIRRHAMSVAA